MSITMTMNNGDLSETELRNLPAILRAGDAKRILRVSDEGLRSLRQALEGTPSDIVAFRLGAHFRYLKSKVFRQARLDHLLESRTITTQPTKK